MKNRKEKATFSLRPSRREFVYGTGASLGALALTDLLAIEKGPGPLAAKAPMHPAKAKAVIMLFMEGGPSQVDTFDPKPELNRLHLTESKRTEGLATGKRFYVGSPFKSRKVGQSGICLLYTSPSPRDLSTSRMPSSA